MNKVHLTGRISRVGPLKYSPAGQALLEFTLAVGQEAYSKTSVGYFQVIVSDRLAEDSKELLKIGMTVSVEGHLYQRAYTSRSGNRVDETKIVLEKFGG